MLPFDPSRFGRFHNKQTYDFSKKDVDNRQAGSFGKLPELWEEDDDHSGKKAKPTNGLLFSTTAEYHQQQEPAKDFHNLDALFLDTTPPFPSYQMQELADIESQYTELIKPHPHPKTTETPKAGGQKLSTDGVIRLGGERFVQSRSSTMNDVSMPSHPYSTSFSGLSDREVKDVELIENLLLSAEKVSQRQFERSSKLLDWCDGSSYSFGNPIQRLVHHFSKALREKIARETGRISLHGLAKKHLSDIEGKMTTPNPTIISVYQKLPFFQAGQFSAVQALVDGVSGATKVHVIDLSIKNGVQNTILMQALSSQANCPIEHLKVTAIGTNLNFRQNIEQTGERLKSFAESVNLSFSFNVVMVEDMLDFKEDLLDLDPEEALAVYSSYALWSMISQQDRLESLMKVIKNTNPRVMVVSEAAANLNSPNFVDRFIEALFFYGALFDSLEDCMGREDENRAITESMYLNQGIWSNVAAEGAERVIRHVNIDVWRKFFARFGMNEIELSMSCLYQANLMAEKLSCGSSCTFEMDGNCLIIGWKGSPIQCLSAWKFS
ncbi:DELLA protein RGL1-like [Cynara cardunculus var. scolymus]|uniref:DELLA protein RGL1-like n=1 Tax=Cynara cardunculus var. scolymus TaxID=59895 RepID=UPI000D625A1C|nr:DELLA protein RGL1-like [Cynara cardunculus var. scolymus]